MNLQEAFDIIVEHARTMPGRAMTKSGCMYRTPQGGRCFIGVLVPDDLYTKEMEGWPLYDFQGERFCAPFVHKVLLEVGLSDADQITLSHLQNIHDNYEPSLWDLKLKDFAGKHGLKMPRRKKGVVYAR